MDKREILRRLDAFPYDRGDWWLVAGGAMVLYGLRDRAGDIDLGCTAAMADRLAADGCKPSRTADGKRRFRYGEDIEIFEEWLRDAVTTVEGIPVVTVRGLMEMKRELGREKDLADVARIEAYLRQREEESVKKRAAE